MIHGSCKKKTRHFSIVKEVSLPLLAIPTRPSPRTRARLHGHVHSIAGLSREVPTSRPVPILRRVDPLQTHVHDMGLSFLDGTRFGGWCEGNHLWGVPLKKTPPPYPPKGFL